MVTLSKNEMGMIGGGIFVLLIIVFLIARRRPASASSSPHPQAPSTPSAQAAPSLMTIMRNSTFFSSMTDEDLELIVTIVQGGIIDPGQILFQEGTEEESAYIIVKGHLDIYQRRGGQNVQLATLGPGEIIGEMAFLTGEPRSATAVAKDQAWLLRIEQEAFGTIASVNPQIRKKLMASYASRTLENCMRDLQVPGVEGWTAEKWLLAAQEVRPSQPQVAVPDGVEAVFVFAGEVATEQGSHEAPTMLPVVGGQTLAIQSKGSTTLYWLPHRQATSAA